MLRVLYEIYTWLIQIKFVVVNIYAMNSQMVMIIGFNDCNLLGKIDSLITSLVEFTNKPLSHHNNNNNVTQFLFGILSIIEADISAPTPN